MISCFDSVKFHFQDLEHYGQSCSYSICIKASVFTHSATQAPSAQARWLVWSGCVSFPAYVPLPPFPALPLSWLIPLVFAGQGKEGDSFLLTEFCLVISFFFPWWAVAFWFSIRLLMMMWMYGSTFSSSNKGLNLEGLCRLHNLQ